jgi:hypothetical protein
VTTATIDPHGISTSIYEVTDTQIHSRTFIPMEVTERLLYICAARVVSKASISVSHSASCWSRNS